MPPVHPLAAAGASWDVDPSAGAWVAARLGPFGPGVGHAVPQVYDAYAVVPLGPDPHDPDDPDLREDARTTLARVLEVLAPVTGDQPVHCGLWDGWGFLYDHGADPRTAPGTGVVVGWDVDDPRPDPDEIARSLAEGQEELARRRVERPAAEPLRLPHREYVLWTGPLRSALALDGAEAAAPSLVWPDDRAWFVAVPIYTREIAVGGSAAVVAALLADPRLGARRAGPDDLLDGDD